MSVRLGSSLSAIKKVYPPTKPWPSKREPNEGVDRIQLHLEDAKYFPVGVEQIIVDMRRGEVVKVKAVFDTDQTRKQPLSALVKDLSQQYGEPRRIGMTYGWQDDQSLLKAYDAPVKKKDGSVSLRTAIELSDLAAFRSEQE